jgi:hypothetical protein
MSTLVKGQVQSTQANVAFGHQKHPNIHTNLLKTK